MKIKKTIILALGIVFLVNCTDSATYITTYKVVNATDYDVMLRFYKSNTLGQSSFVFQTNLDGPGLVLERRLETTSLDTNNATDAYKADSVAVIFNDVKLEAHTFLEPFESSIMDEGDYIINKNINEYTYTITEENYNNATPCNGSCN